MKSAGIHHITGIAGDPKRHVAFYTHVLGLRMVKKTVNFDDPGTWHLYYGDETGSPGTALTFFLWGGLGAGRQGIGQAVETAFAIPAQAVDYWIKRLVEKAVPHETPFQRFGETVISLRDPDGLRLELVASPAADTLPGWSGGEVPSEYAIRGFYGITLWANDPAPTAQVLTQAFGFTSAQHDKERRRFVAEGQKLGSVIDIRIVPGVSQDTVGQGALGQGTLHHVAFRAANDADQLAMAAQVRALGLRPTDQIDRQYFRSVYFQEPGGVIMEIATDEPGFTLDEPKQTLGTALKLPPWYEAHRAKIEAVLPPLV